MSLISVDNAKFSNHAGILFNDANFTINEDDRIGLVGNNGCGKSTLLKAIMGLVQLDEGKIQIKKGLKIGYIAQSIPSKFEDMTLYEVLLDAIPQEERLYSQYKIEMTLEALGATKDIYDRKMSKLSGGWRRLALIARTNLDDPDILLLDEPTNHLDVGKIIHLEKWLNETVFVPYLVVSHDRQFLDNCTNKTLVMRDGKIYSYKSSFTKAKELLSADDYSNEKERNIRQKEIDKLAQTAKDFKIKGKTHGSERLSRVAMSLETRIKRMESELPEVYQEKVRNIGLGVNEIGYNKPIVKIHNLEIKIPQGQSLFCIEQLIISKGQRIAILGLNGTGKSVFVRELMNAYVRQKSKSEDCSNAIYFNPRIVVGYIDQELSVLPKNEKIRDFIKSRFSFDSTKATRELVQAGFTVNEQEAQIDTLSYGQKARLAFLLLKNEQPNFYIMDEPTNHLDIDGQERLEQAILENDNPCVLVSHDRKFISNVANIFYVIENGHLKQIDSPEDFFLTSSIEQNLEAKKEKKSFNLKEL